MLVDVLPYQLHLKISQAVVKCLPRSLGHGIGVSLDFPSHHHRAHPTYM